MGFLSYPKTTDCGLGTGGGGSEPLPPPPGYGPEEFLTGGGGGGGFRVLESDPVGIFKRTSAQKNLRGLNPLNSTGSASAT